jgi:hypothetical protein
MRPHKRRIDAEPSKRPEHVLPERVVADLGHHRGAPTEPRCRDRNVRRAATQHLAERSYLRGPYADLLGIEIDRHAADRQDLRDHSEPETRA